MDHSLPICLIKCRLYQSKTCLKHKYLEIPKFLLTPDALLSLNKIGSKRDKVIFNIGQTLQVRRGQLTEIQK